MVEPRIGAADEPLHEALDSFRKWLKKELGLKKFNEWWGKQVREGRDVRATKEYAEYFAWTQRSPEEVAADLPEEIFTDEFELSDLPQLGEGFEWVETTTDPATGTPIRPQWVSRPVTEEPTEFQPTEEEIQQAWRIAAGLEPPVSDDQLTPWQVVQIDRWETDRGIAEEALTFERGQVEEARAWQVSQAAQERMGSQRERELSDRLRLQQELAGLGGPADWIKRWQMIHGVIPRAEAAQARERSWMLLQEAQNLTGAERTMKEMQADNLWSTAMTLSQQAELGATPPTPEWLPQFAETQVAGEPITPGRTTTPSGQQWIATPQSQREGLRGFTEFAGFRPLSDILDQMAMMQTRTPQGAGRTRWQAAQQRA